MKRSLFSIKPFFFAAIFLINVPLLFAQSNDWGLWTSVDVDKKLSKKWDLNVTTQYRWKDNISVTDQIRGSVDASYRTGKYVKLAAGYEMISKYKAKRDIFVYRNRFRAQATGSYKYDRFTVDWRPRVQLTLLGKNETDSKTSEDDNGKWVLRNRFGLKYDIKKTPLKPYVNFEMFHYLFGNLEYSYYRNRFSVGTDYKINKQHSLELGYKRESEINGFNISSINIVKLGYTFSF